MSSQKDFTCWADTGLMTDNLGNGAGSALWAAYGYPDQMRMLLKFNLDWTNVTSIVSAVFYCRSYHLWAYHTPIVVIRRNTGAWDEGSYNGGDNGAGYQGDGANYPGPAVTEDDKVTWQPPATHDAWTGTDITAIVRKWAPSATVIGGGDQPNYGISIRESVEGNSVNNWDIWSKQGGYGAYIRLTYETNQPPTTPTIEAYGNVSSQTPGLRFLYSDSDGDNGTQFQLQVAAAADTTFASPLYDTGVVTQAIANNSWTTVTPTARARGAAYIYRVKVKDSLAWSAWSSSGSFTVLSLEVALFDHFAELLGLHTQIDFDTDTLKLMLLTSAWTPDASVQYRSGLSQEASGSGYTAGGATVTGVTAGWNAGGKFNYITANNVAWAGLGATFRYAVLYKSTGNAATDPLILYIDFATNQSPAGGTFTVQWAATADGGMIKFTVV